MFGRFTPTVALSLLRSPVDSCWSTLGKISGKWRNRIKAADLGVGNVTSNEALDFQAVAFFT
jgi:hypothetical protein